MRIIIHEGEPPVEARDVSQLDEVVHSATEEAHAQGLLSIIFLEAENANRMSLVVGAAETALDFVCGDKKPPYYASKGTDKNEEPVLTAYVALQHHTEIPRNRLIRMEEGISAAHAFFETGELPTCIEWAQV
jgi:hypothetical protein